MAQLGGRDLGDWVGREVEAGREGGEGIVEVGIGAETDQWEDRGQAEGRRHWLPLPGGRRRRGRGLRRARSSFVAYLSSVCFGTKPVIRLVLSFDIRHHIKNFTLIVFSGKLSSFASSHLFGLLI